ncbi:MAG: glycosyltransferase family 4 protein [Armatimonadetes bacterium]|nr:glycosyltransferase family 4 protein [Armatimonadota bacterium]
MDDLRRMDMGVVPLPVNEWNKRKFYMKVAQYMALGISHVATPMGSNPEVIQPGVTGFLADTASEWVECLTRLIRDPGLREDMGRKGAQIAEEKFSLRANTPQIIEAFRTAVS